MVFVWSPVTEFTNSTEWFTVPWTYPSVLRQSYDFQQSDIIFVPGRMNFFIIGMRVAGLWSGTAVKNNFLLSRSMPPNTQQPSTLLPLWYLRFQILTRVFPELSVTNFWPSSVRWSGFIHLQQIHHQNEVQVPTLCLTLCLRRVWLWLRREHHWLRYSLSVSVSVRLIAVCGLQTCLIRQGGQNTSFFSVFEGVLYAKKAKRSIEAGNCPPYCILVWRTENGVLIWSDTVART